MKNFDLKKFKDFVDTYDSQRGHEDYEVRTIIDDFLYGIGICLNEDEYKNADGYQKFQEVLREHLKMKVNDTLQDEKHGTCWCGQSIDLTNLDCVEFALCKDHASDA